MKSWKQKINTQNELTTRHADQKQICRIEHSWKENDGKAMTGYARQT